MAQIWVLPTEIFDALLIPLIVTGVLDCDAIEVPSIPCPYQPQHLTLPLTITQVFEVPVLIALAPVIPLTATAVLRFVVVPSPS